MEICLALIVARRRGVTGTLGGVLEAYIQRSARYCPCSVKLFSAEEKLLGFLEGTTGRSKPVFLAADSCGDQVTSVELASELGRRFDCGVQLLVLGIGPADGWGTRALQRADRKIAFGRITLPHELAAVVSAEQIYRALTIRAGHPYHSGH